MYDPIYNFFLGDPPRVFPLFFSKKKQGANGYFLCLGPGGFGKP